MGEYHWVLFHRGLRCWPGWRRDYHPSFACDAYRGAEVRVRGYDCLLFRREAFVVTNDSRSIAHGNTTIW